jgi:hypothetical protein
MRKTARRVHLGLGLGIVLWLVGHGADAASCTEEVGAKAAAKLVRQCIQISPSTHPPCNALNSCEMIKSEIKHGCSFFLNDPAPPKFCLDLEPPAKPITVRATIVSGGGIDNLFLTFVALDSHKKVTAYCDQHCGDWFEPGEDPDSNFLRREFKGKNIVVTYATERNNDRIVGPDNGEMLLFIKKIRILK